MPTKPHVIGIKGSSASVVGDTVRVILYTGDTARGTATAVLDSNKEAVVSLANISTSYSDGDTVVVSESGGALGGNSTTVSGGGAQVTITATAVALPSISL